MLLERKEKVLCDVDTRISRTFPSITNYRMIWFYIARQWKRVLKSEALPNKHKNISHTSRRCAAPRRIKHDDEMFNDINWQQTMKRREEERAEKCNWTWLTINYSINNSREAVRSHIIRIFNEKLNSINKNCQEIHHAFIFRRGALCEARKK